MADNTTLVKRSDKKSFWGIPATTKAGEPTFTRMRGFSEMSGSKNPKEYSRQYVDESFEQTDVTGYSPSWSFSFDEYIGNLVNEDIVSIIDGEMLGSDAVRDIVFVNFTKPVTGGGFEATRRSWSIIADSEGGSMDAYTYSGNLRVKGNAVKGVAKVATPTSGDSETVETITFEVPVTSEILGGGI